MANAVTVCRILLSAALLLTETFSPAFAVAYLLAGLTDMIDGAIARKTKTAGEFGAKLDTVADICFFLAAACKIFPVLRLPLWLWAWTALIAAAKVGNLISAVALREEFAAAHTFANKAAGLALFLFPLSLPFINPAYGACFVCVIATFAAARESCHIRLEIRKGQKAMKERGKQTLKIGGALLAVFALWTALIQCVDVRPVGQNGTNVGFAAFNVWFHELTGAHMGIYVVTDWLGLVPMAVCLAFGVVGLIQLLKRRSLKKVDMDLILLGVYYVLVIAAYLIFEMVPINYRPILIEGVMEASYPSSTTLLVLSVMPTLKFQIDRRAARASVKKATSAFVILFSAFMVLGRLVSGVHWFTDIVGAVILSAGLFALYRGAVLLTDKE